MVMYIHASNTDEALFLRRKGVKVYERHIKFNLRIFLIQINLNLFVLRLFQFKEKKSHKPLNINV